MLLRPRCSLGLFALLCLSLGCYKLTYKDYKGDADAGPDAPRDTGRPDSSGGVGDVPAATAGAGGAGGFGGNRSVASGGDTSSGGKGLSASGGEGSDPGTTDTNTSAGGTAGSAAGGSTGNAGGNTSTARTSARTPRDAGPDGTSDAFVNLSSADLCIATGGKVESAQCCTGVVDFPNLCVRTGSCACAPSSSHAVTVCTCPGSTCFDTRTGCISPSIVDGGTDSGDSGVGGTGGIASGGGSTTSGGDTGTGGVVAGGSASAGGTTSSGGTTSTGVTLVQGLNVLAGIASGQGSADGIGEKARFNGPFGLAVDNAGTIYVADTASATIRKITPAGVVTTFAGRAGSLGSTDGTGAGARFNVPTDIAIDGSGNLYIADFWNNVIRKISPAGVVTTFAGTAGYAGSTDDTGAAARFNQPSGVATDGEGNVFVADSMNHTIRKITSAGVVTTIAGAAGSSGSVDGTGAAALFSRPSGVAVDGAGNILVADTDNHVIRRIAPGGVVTTLAGTPGSCGATDGTGVDARFCLPGDVAVDSAGNVFVADTQLSTIRKVSPTGVVTTLAGTPGSVSHDPGIPAFMQPRGIAVDSAGYIIVADTGNDIIRRVTPTGVVTTLAGVAEWPRFANGPQALFHPMGMAVDGAGNIFVAAFGVHAIRKVTPTGAITTVAGSGVPGYTDGVGTSASFNTPYGIAVDGTGTLFVAEYGNHTIRKIAPTGATTTLAGTAGLSGSDDGAGTAARFASPHALALDAAGNLFVADTGNHTIRKITPSGVVSTFAGTAGSSGSTNGTGTNARLAEPYGLAVDQMGNIFVADTSNHTIRKITPAGVVTTFAGVAGSSGSVDGTGSAARFNRPQGVAVDGANNVLVADTDNHIIRKIAASGMVSTIVGVADPSTVGNFPGPLPASIFSPWSVAVDNSNGNLYIAVDDAILVAVFPK